MPAEDQPPRKLSLVIPVYNEVESLAKLKDEIDAVGQSLNHAIEIIFVDDGSTDGSWNTIRALAGADARVHGIRFRRNFGKAAALEAGFRKITGDIVFTLDADLQDDPKEIPQFLAKLDAGYDLVSGYKQVRHDPWHKVFPSRVFNWMISRITGVKLHDHNCGFKAYRAEVTREVRLYGELHRFVPVLAAARGFRISEIVVEHRARKFGKSKFGARRFLKGFLDLVQTSFITTFGWRPMHFFGTIATLLFLLAAAGIALLGANAILRELIDDKWGFGVGVQFTMILGIAVLGIIGVNAIFIGYIAELLASRRIDEPFAIAEST